MQVEQFLLEILLSIGLGTLIGIERERRAKGEIFAGVRTFALVTLLGYLSALSKEFLGNVFGLYIAFTGVSLIAIVNHFLTYKKIKRVGVTSEIAFIIGFLIGVFVYFDSFPYVIPVSLSILTTLILFSREAAHKFARHLKRKELRDVIIFSILAFIILPILPDKYLDPLQIFNPYLIWLSIVLILAISFLGYVGVKIFGSKGLIISGFFGGLFSSTFVTATMAERIKEKEKLFYPSISAIFLSFSTAYLRLLTILLIFNFKLLDYLLFPLLLLSILTACFIYPFIKGRKSKREMVKLKSPLSFKAAFQFGLVLILILAFIKITLRIFPEEGIYLVSFLSGMADVDAITISLSVSEIYLDLVAKCIILATISNTIFKFFLLNSIAGFGISKRVILQFSFLLIISFLLFLLI